MKLQKNYLIEDDKILAKLSSLTVDDLEKYIKKFDYYYWVKDLPKISDETYDKLVEALRAVKPTSHLLQNVGEKQFFSHQEQRIKHLTPMLSLDKCYDDTTFVKWKEKIRGPILAMPKIDGLACEIQYHKNGQLFLAVTRGDGIYGENITKNIKEIVDIPNNIAFNKMSSFIKGEFFQIRGEVFLKKSIFKARYSKKFANPRNLAAGALKQKDPQKTKEYDLSFLPYDLHGSTLDNEQDKFALIGKLGFANMPIKIYEQNDQPQNAYRDFSEDIDNFDFEIDGVVYRANNISEQSRLGITSHHPKWMIAYKYQGERAQTLLKEIQWSIGRTGILTPVAIIDPVFLSGATISKASLHNWGNVKKKQLSLDGKIEVVRKGGVIPYVERVLVRGKRDVAPPDKCPFCSNKTLVDEDFIYCSQPNKCLQVMVARVLYFCSSLDMEGFGIGIIKQLVENNLVKKLADIFKLTMDDLLSLERVGPKLASKLLDEINRHKTLSSEELLTSLGVDEIGPTNAKLLTENFGSIDQLKQVKINEICEVHGLGESIAKSFTEGLNIYDDEINQLLKVVSIVNESEIEINTQHPLYKRLVVFTGKMDKIERSWAQKQVRNLGGITPSGVSEKLHYLVVGGNAAKSKKSSKQKKAEEIIKKNNQLKILTEEEFLKML